MEWFFIAIGSVLLGFGTFALIKGFRGLRAVTSPFDRTITPLQGLVSMGIIAVSAGLLPLMLGILSFFIGDPS